MSQDTGESSGFYGVENKLCKPQAEPCYECTHYGETFYISIGILIELCSLFFVMPFAL